jgi:hypothetical protein
MISTGTNLRNQLITALQMKGAHMPYEAAVKDFPLDHINTKAPNVPYSFWHLLDHLRITQKDMLLYVKDPENYREINWPDDYWPSPDQKVTNKDWHQTVKQFQEDNQAFQNFIKNPKTDLFKPLPDTPGHTVIRGVRIIVAHNSYHLGEFGILRQVTNTW